MAKKMRRAISLALVLVLCMTQLAMPAAAREKGKGRRSRPVVTVTVESGRKSAEPASTTERSSSTDAQTNVTTQTETTTTVTPSTNTTEVKTETTTTDPDNNTTVKETVTQTEQSTTTTTGDTTSMEDRSTESSVRETHIGPDTQPKDGAPQTSVTMETDRVETSEKEQTVTTTVQPDPEGKGEKVSTSDTGSQERTDTTVTTVTEVTEDVKTGDSILENDPARTELDQNSVKDETTNDPNDPDTVWTEGDPEKVGKEDWVEGDVVIGGEEDTTTTTVGPVDKGDITLNEDLADDDVVISMKPDEQWNYGSVDITTENLKNGKYPEIYDPAKHKDSKIENTEDGGWTITDPATGAVTTVTPNRKADGTLEGWTVTKVTTTTGERTNVTPGGQTTTGADLVEGSIRTTYLEDPDMEQKLGQVTSSEDKEKGTSQKSWVEKISNPDGSIGYRNVEENTTVVTTGPVSSEIDPNSELYDQYHDYASSTKKTFAKPDNVPQSQAEQVSAGGVKTVVTVSPILAAADSDLVKDGFVKEGDEIGYRVVTVTTSSENNYSSTETQEVYGTAYTETTTTVTDPKTLQTYTTTTTTERKVNEVYNSESTRDMNVTLEKTEEFTTTTVTEKDEYNLFGNEQDGVFYYKGKMYVVTGTATLTEDHNLVGAELVKNADGSFSLKNNTVSFDGDDLRILGENGITDHYTGQFSDWNGIYNSANGEYIKIGSGLYGGFLTWDDTATGSNGSGRHTPQQYMIYNGSEVRFVYCVELNVSATTGAYYSSNKLGDADASSAIWAGAQGNVEKIRIIATNGFWGTREGMGSLDTVKQLLIENGMSDVAGRLTEGIAMAGTQLALWKYGKTSADANFTEEYDSNGVAQGNYVVWDDSINDWAKDSEQQDIAALRNLLISLAEKESGVTTAGTSKQITKDSITGGGITLKNQVMDTDTNQVKEVDGNRAYNTDISFTMDISSSFINGDMIVEILNEQNESVGKYRLAGDNSNSIFGAITRSVKPDDNGNYILEDVELFENQKVTLNLKGIQHLEDGIYIYSNPNKQDFVGLSTKNNNVDLKVTMEFEVEDPVVEHTYEQETKERTDRVTSTAKSKRQDKVTTVRTYYYEEDDTQVSRRKDVLSTITRIDTLEEKTRERLSWEIFYEQLLTTINDEDGGEDTGDDGEGTGDDGIIIPDEEVPLASAPKTGDATALWAAISLLALAGAWAVSLEPRRKER